MAPEAPYQPSPALPQDEAAGQLAGVASVLGRIGVRAFIIVLLMLAALGVLSYVFVVGDVKRVVFPLPAKAP